MGQQGLAAAGAGLGSEVSLADFRKDIILEFYNEAGQLAIAYKVFRCWVSEYQALPDLDANANAVAIQHIKLENEGWERDTAVTEPTEPTLYAGSNASQRGHRANDPCARHRRGAARPLQGEVLLAAWERGSELPAALRALPLLAAGCGLDERQAAALPMCRRATPPCWRCARCSFGDALHAFATCDACGERLEFALSVAEVAGRSATQRGTPEPRGTTTGRSSAASRRSATSRRLRATADLEAGRELLLARCVSVLDANGRAIGFADLPPDVRAAAEQRLAAMHEAAELGVALACAACGARSRWRWIRRNSCGRRPPRRAALAGRRARTRLGLWLA